MNGNALLPALVAVSGLLVVSGAAKLRNPGPAAAALRSLGVRPARHVALAAACAELVTGIACLVRPGTAAPVVGVLYLAFAGLVALELRRGIDGSCGCLGSAETPPSPLQLALDLAFAAIAFAAVRFPPQALPGLVAQHPLAGLFVAAAAAAATFLCAAALVLVPPALAAYRRPTA